MSHGASDKAFFERKDTKSLSRKVVIAAGINIVTHPQIYRAIK